MAFGPGALVGTAGVGGVHLFGTQAGLSRCGVALEKFGVIVDGGFEFFVAVVEGARGAQRGVEINSPLVLLQGRAGDFERLVVSIVDDGFERVLAGRADLRGGVLDVDLLAVALHVNAADFAGAEVLVFVALKFHGALEIRLGGIDGKDEAFDRNIFRNGESDDGVFALLRLLQAGADGSPDGLARARDSGGAAVDVGWLYRAVGGDTQVFVGAERNLERAVVAEFFVGQIVESGGAEGSPSGAVRVVLAFDASVRDV